jgi:tellurite resistance protein TehA-like permease
MTAAGLLGIAAQQVLPQPYNSGAAVFALLYGVIVCGFAALWLTLAAAITVRTARQHLPFSLTWWSFTFPVGTLVTGTSGLADRTGLDVFTWAAVALFALLVTAWVVVGRRTVRGVRDGSLLPITS